MRIMSFILFTREISDDSRNVVGKLYRKLVYDG